MRLTSDDGAHTADVTAGQHDGRPGVLAIAYHKSGSVLLDGVLAAICKATGRTYVRPDSELFDQGYDSPSFDRAIAELFSPDGHVYGVFRTRLDAFTCAVARAMRRIILVRNPLDAVTSYYFSLRYSHRIPDQGTVHDNLTQIRSTLSVKEIDECVQSDQFHFLFMNMAAIARLMPEPGVTVYRYEDVVFQKRRWFADLAAKLDVSVADDVLDRLLDRFDLVPPQEQAREHIRRVVPGDHKNKLSKRSIAYLTGNYGSVMQELGYPVS